MKVNRSLWVLLHRWGGLAITLFVLIAGVTGSIIAFNEELDRWLTPPVVVPSQGRTPLTPGELAERALARVPGARVTSQNLRLRPEQGVTINFDRHGVATPASIPQSIVLDPYSGAEISREAGPADPDAYPYWPLTRKNVLAFINALHYSLAVPGDLGIWLFGIAAILWTIDCFVGFYLTLPAMRRQVVNEELSASASKTRRGFLARWAVSWKIDWRGSTYRVNLDLHRAFSLWTWLMLLVLAWSSVSFNLNSQVYVPVMKALFGLQDPYPVQPKLEKPRLEPALRWREAYELGRRYMAEQARLNHFQVDWEQYLNYDPDKGLFTFAAHTTRDVAERWGDTTVVFHDGDGAFIGLVVPTGQNAAATFGTWIASLHFAAMWGLPMKIFLSFMGGVTAMLSVTGVYLWWKKRSARRRREQTAGS